MRTRVVVAILGSVGTTIGGWGCSDQLQGHSVVLTGASSGTAGVAASGAGSSSGTAPVLVAVLPSTPVSSGEPSSDAGLGVGPATDATSPTVPTAPSATVAAEASVPATGSSADASSAASLGSPPPISGGTLLLLADGHTVAASDPDRNRVYVADTQGAMALKSTTTLNAGDEPGRLVQDGAGRVHVALRSAGAVLTIDPTTGSIVDRRSVCPAPRGIAWDGATDTVWVACATGELVGLPASGGQPSAQWVVERDLRDVVVAGSELLVSEFRSAEILHISMVDGTVISRDTILSDPNAAPHMAWRTTRFGSNGMTAMLHQRHGRQNIDTMRPDSYRQVNSVPIVSPQCAVHAADGSLVSTFPLHAALAFDLAASADGTKVAVIGAGSTNTSLSAAIVELAAIDGSSDNVLTLAQWRNIPGGATSASQAPPQATAVAFDASGNIVVQTREPAALWRLDPSLDLDNAQHVSLSSISRDDPRARHLPRAHQCEPRVRVVPRRGWRRWARLDPQRAATPHPVAAWNDRGDGPVPLGRRRDRLSNPHGRRLHRPYGGTDPQHHPNEPAGSVGRVDPRPRSAHVGRRRIGCARCGAVRDAEHRLQHLPFGGEAHQQPDYRRRYGAAVPGASARRSRLARAVPARRLCNHARRPLRPLRYGGARRHLVARHARYRRPRQLPRNVVSVLLAAVAP
jgi:hypothetical protein